MKLLLLTLVLLSTKVNAQIIPFGMLQRNEVTTISYKDTETTIVEVTSATGRIWMDRNPGATRAATSSTDYLAYGDLFQWGRGADGHQIIGWTSSTASDGIEQNNETSSTTALSTAPTGQFIIGSGNWYTGTNHDDLWIKNQTGVNDPCPSGYRLPTEDEFKAEISTWSSTNSTGAFASPLKLPMAG